MLVRATGPTAKARAKKARQDRAVAATVRELVAARDGHCRYAWDVPPTERTPCWGNAECAHWAGWKRFKTRGQDPKRRHLTTGSLMLCTFHHQRYDGHRLVIAALTEAGCDGPLTYQEDKR